jgi:MFS family permease
MIDIIMTPIRAIRVRYIPLLLIYFAYGSSVFVGIAQSFWIKKELALSAEDLVALSVWLMVPWTIKMIFGQLVDSVTIFGSNRKIYIFIGAILMALSTLLLIGIIGEHQWIAGYNKESVYIFASVLGVVGFVLQDVVADTMSTEVVDQTQSEDAIKKELAIIQVLSRLSLGLAVFIMGWLGGELSSIYDYETVYKLSLFIPVLSILGVVFVRLNPVASTPLNKKIFFGGLLFALFIIIMGYTDVPFSQEIVFVVSLVIVLYFLGILIQDLPEKTIKHIKMAMIVIFVYQATAYVRVGAALQWWEIDILGFDESFFAKLSAISGGIALVGLWISAKFIVNKSIGGVLMFLTIILSILSLPTLFLYYDMHTMFGIDARTVALLNTALDSPFQYIATVLMLTLVAIYAPEGKKGTWFALMASFMNIALSASGLFSKYLNQVFVLTREIKKDGIVITPANYDDLGIFLWIVIGVGFVFPIIAIWLFNPDSKKGRE